MKITNISIDIDRQTQTYRHRYRYKIPLKGNITYIRSKSNSTFLHWKGFVRVSILSGNSAELNKIQTWSRNYTDTDAEFYLKKGFCSKSLNTSHLFHTALRYWILYYHNYNSKIINMLLQYILLRNPWPPYIKNTKWIIILLYILYFITLYAI